MGFLRLLGSVLYTIVYPFTTVTDSWTLFILFRVWLTLGPPLPRRHDENPTRTTRTRSVLRCDDRPFLSDLGEAGGMIFRPGKITLALTQPPHSFDSPIFFVILIVPLLPLRVTHSQVFLADDSLCSRKSLITTATTAPHGLFFLLWPPSSQFIQTIFFDDESSFLPPLCYPHHPPIHQTFVSKHIYRLSVIYIALSAVGYYLERRLGRPPLKREGRERTGRRGYGGMMMGVIQWLMLDTVVYWYLQSATHSSDLRPHRFELHKGEGRFASDELGAY